MTSPAPQHVISAACEEDLIKYGDNFRGVGYTKSAAEAAERNALMLGVIRETDTPVTILDLGCGLGHLLDFIESHADYRHVQYAGLDISSRYLNAARARHPQHEFILMDVDDPDEQLRIFDYVVLNGVFNFRGPIERSDMLRYWQHLTTTVGQPDPVSDASRYLMISSRRAGDWHSMRSARSSIKIHRCLGTSAIGFMTACEAKLTNCATMRRNWRPYVRNVRIGSKRSSGKRPCLDLTLFSSNTSCRRRGPTRKLSGRRQAGA